MAEVGRSHLAHGKIDVTPYTKYAAMNVTLITCQQAALGVAGVATNEVETVAETGRAEKV